HGRTFLQGDCRNAGSSDWHGDVATFPCPRAACGDAGRAGARQGVAMKCSDARELLDAYADDELDLLTSRRIDEHVEQCARCRLAMDHVRAIKVVVSHPSHYHRAPSQLRARVLALMHQPAGLPRSPKAI